MLRRSKRHLPTGPYGDTPTDEEGVRGYWGAISTDELIRVFERYAQTTDEEPLAQPPAGLSEKDSNAYMKLMNGARAVPVLIRKLANGGYETCEYIRAYVNRVDEYNMKGALCSPHLIVMQFFYDHLTGTRTVYNQHYDGRQYLASTSKSTTCDMIEHAIRRPSYYALPYNRDWLMPSSEPKLTLTELLAQRGVNPRVTRWNHAGDARTDVRYQDPLPSKQLIDSLNRLASVAYHGPKSWGCDDCNDTFATVDDAIAHATNCNHERSKMRTIPARVI